VEAPAPTAAAPATATRAATTLAPESLAPAKEERVALADIVQAIAGEKVTVAAMEGGYELIVKFSGGRYQTVYLTEEHDAKHGTDLIRVFTPCAPVSSRAFKWALETNCRLTTGAVGIRKVGGKEMFVICDTYPAAGVTSKRVRDAVFAIAEAGDTVEKGMTRANQF
jgi:hypothetical protein